MWKLILVPLMVLLLCSGSSAAADDLTGADRFLCTPSQATLCVEDGEYAVDLPWNVNIPQVIEVDPQARRLATPEASGENRQTAIEHLHRADGSIVFHGFEMGRAFSWVIDEASGRVTAAIATDGISVGILGACTPVAGEGEESSR